MSLTAKLKFGTPEQFTNLCGPQHNSIIINSNGQVYVAGTTEASTFPITPNSYDTTYNGGVDVVIFKLNSDLTTLLASTFLGGSNDDGWNAPAIALDNIGQVYIVDRTNSSDFPTMLSAYDRTANGTYDIFVSKFDANLSTDAFTCSTVTELSQSECEALIALYSNTNGANWTNNTDWLQTNTPCSWNGVICEAGSVTQIDLGHNTMIGSLPPEIGNLSQLKNLYLHVNKLSRSLPPEIGNLTNLEILYLDENQLTGNIPPEIGNLSSLTRLVLYINQLSGSIPPEIGNLSNLTELNLCVNQLNGTIPLEIWNLPNLQKLSLHNNQFTGNLPHGIQNLSSTLQYLSLTYNQLDGEIPAEIGNLTDLIALELDRNQFTGTIPVEIGNLNRLQLLNLSENLLNGNIPWELGNLSLLERLYLHKTQLSGQLPATFTNLTNVQQFWFQNTNLCEPQEPVFQTCRVFSTAVLKNTHDAFYQGGLGQKFVIMVF